MEEYKKWLVSKNNPDYTGKEEYVGQDRFFVKLITKAIELQLIMADEVEILNLQWLEGFVNLYNLNAQLQSIDYKFIGHKAGIASLKKFINYVRYIKYNAAVDIDVKSKRY